MHRTAITRRRSEISVPTVSCLLLSPVILQTLRLKSHEPMAPCKRTPSKVSAMYDGSQLCAQKATFVGIFYRSTGLDACLLGAEIPLPGPRPTSSLGRRSRLEASCPVSGHRRCYRDCVDTSSNIFHCGGCADEDGQDCSELGDDVACIKGQCVVY